jgi:hypothetical protein
MNLVFTVSFGNRFRGACYPWLRDLLQKSELLTHICRAPEVDLMAKRRRTGTGNLTREPRALAVISLVNIELLRPWSFVFLPYNMAYGMGFLAPKQNRAYGDRFPSHACRAAPCRPRHCSDGG